MREKAETILCVLVIGAILSVYLTDEAYSQYWPFIAILGISVGAGATIFYYLGRWAGYDEGHCKGYELGYKHGEGKH